MHSFNLGLIFHVLKLMYLVHTVMYISLNREAMIFFYDLKKKKNLFVDAMLKSSWFNKGALPKEKENSSVRVRPKTF